MGAPGSVRDVTVPAPTEPAAAPAVDLGWYPDPWQQAAQRWWDGRVWTSHTA